MHVALINTAWPESVPRPGRYPPDELTRAGAGYIVRRGNGEGRGSRIRPAFKMAGSS